MIDLLTLSLLPVVAVVATLTVLHAYRSFETPRAIVYVAALPIGLAQMLAGFGAGALLGDLVPLFALTGAAIALAGAIALAIVVMRLIPGGLHARTTPFH